jgi:hypothetical protein
MGQRGSQTMGQTCTKEESESMQIVNQGHNDRPGWISSKNGSVSRVDATVDGLDAGARGNGI